MVRTNAIIGIHCGHRQGVSADRGDGGGGDAQCEQLKFYPHTHTHTHQAIKEKNVWKTIGTVTLKWSVIQRTIIGPP